MLHFCTYFDSNYLLRGLTMYRSLVASGCEFVLHVLALDEPCKRLIDSLALPHLRSISLKCLEDANPKLLVAKQSRSKIEYYFTLSPVLPLYILDRNSSIDLVTYLDADLYFYQSPKELLDSMGGKSILICEHRFPPTMAHQLIYGRFNVQFQSFRRDAVGMACLRRWRDQCIEWCFDRVEDDRYADQRYLDEWPSLYGDSLAIVAHPGAGVAPWNWSAHPMILREGKLHVGGHPLIFYHFHGVKIVNSWLISTGLANWGLMPYRIRRWLYAGYIRQIRQSRALIADHVGVALPMSDKIIRGKGIAVASLGEIARKAWSQIMLIP